MAKVLESVPTLGQNQLLLGLGPLFRQLCLGLAPCLKFPECLLGNRAWTCQHPQVCACARELSAGWVPSTHTGDAGGQRLWKSPLLPPAPASCSCPLPKILRGFPRPEPRCLHWTGGSLRIPPRFPGLTAPQAPGGITSPGKAQGSSTRLAEPGSPWGAGACPRAGERILRASGGGASPTRLAEMLLFRASTASMRLRACSRLSSSSLRSCWRILVGRTCSWRSGHQGEEPQGSSQAPGC